MRSVDHKDKTLKFPKFEMTRRLLFIEKKETPGNFKVWEISAKIKNSKIFILISFTFFKIFFSIEFTNSDQLAKRRLMVDFIFKFLQTFLSQI